MTYRNRHTMTLVDKATGQQLAHDGKVKIVEKDGTAQVDAATTEEGSYITTETMTFSDGLIEFYTPDTVRAVDIYYFTEHGYAGVVKGAVPGAVSEVPVDTNNLQQTILYPFNAGDTNATIGSSVDTGIKLGDRAQLLADGVGVNVITADATETLDAGVVSTSGVDDPDGLLALVALGTAGFIEETGAALMPHVTAGGSDANTETLVYTLSAGTDTATGFILLRSQLAQPVL